MAVMVSIIRRLRYFLTLALLLAVFLAPHSALAQSSTGLTLSAQAGFEGYCRSFIWIPVQAFLENTGSDLEGILEVRQVQSSTLPDVSSYRQQVNLPAQSRKQVTVYLYPEGYLGQVKVSLWVNGQVAASTEVRLNCLGPTDRLFGVVSESSTPFNILSRLDPPNSSAAVAQIRLADLPDQAPPLEALDTLIISGVDSGTLTPGQRAALEAWVGSGGQLVVTGGSDWQRTAAGFTNLLPLQPQNSRSLPALTGLARFSLQPDSLEGSTPVVQGSLQAGAEVLAEEAGVPLVIAEENGLGRVIYLAFDPALQPFASWPGQEDFYRQLFPFETSRPVWGWGFQSWDMAASAANSLSGLQIPGAGRVIGFLFLYVAAIGPLNYLIVHRMKRRELAWLTTPALILLFSLLAFIIGIQGQGNLPEVNRLAMVQIYPGSANARVDGLVGVFSPRRTSLNLELGPDYLMHTIPVSYGGPDSRRWNFFQTPGGGSTIPELNIDVGGLQTVAVEGYTPAPDLHGAVNIELDGSSAVVRGQVVNNSGFDLEDVVLLAPGGTQEIGRLPAGEEKNVELQLETAYQSGYGGLNGPKYLSGGYVPYYGQDDWMSAVVGTTDYYNSAEGYRRYSLLMALTNNNQFGSFSSDGEVYLAGWSAASPIDAGLAGQKFNHRDSTLYIVRLDSDLSLTGSQWVIQPGMFTWQILENSPSVGPSPYNMYFNQGSYSMAFQPVHSIPYRRVDSLTLHLAGYNAYGPVNFDVFLWDFTESAWQQLPVTDWGDYPVPSPQRFVGLSGEVRLRIENNTIDTVSIEKSDFTLVVEP